MLLIISKKKYKEISESVQQLADNQKRLAEEGKRIAEYSKWDFVFKLFIGFAIGWMIGKILFSDK